jgi:hypothetical protein
MTIIADRGLFVRLLVQSGKFEQGHAEALADSLDSAAKDPATRLDVLEVKTDIALLRTELAQQRTELKGDIALAAQRAEALNDRLLVRLGGLMIALVGLLFAALRVT